MANITAKKDAIATSQRRGPGSPTGNRDKVTNQRYRDTVTRWTYRMLEEFNLTDRSFGEYIAKFIEYFEFSTGKKCQIRDGNKNGYAGRLKGAYKNLSFQKLEEDSWILHFVSFCITGELYSDFDTTKYLETGNESLLPNQAWEYKKIPLFSKGSNQTQAPEVFQSKIKELESLVLSLQKKVEAMETCTNTSASFSSLLESWVKSEAQKAQMPMDVVIMDLSNRLGTGSNTVELKDVVYGTYPIEKSRFKHYVMWIAALGILKKPSNQPYSGKELLELPPGITLN